MVDSQQRDIELKWQKIWQEKEIFKPKVDNTKEKFFITVAYPYANSAMHIGHGRTFTMADIIARYNRVLGKNVLYPMAFHISGTPVLAVADAIAKGDKKQIEMTRDAISDYISDKVAQDKLIESFKDPYKIADFFSGKIEETFNTIGFGIDWSRQFSTGNDTYKKFIEWQYKKLFELGILVRGKYPILYSVLDENAVGEDDIKDADIDKVTIQEMTYILFKLEKSEEYLVVCTLRADALFGATNLWVSSKIDLIKLEVNGKIWVVAKDAFNKIKYQFDNVKFICDVNSSDYIGKNVIVPIVNREVIIADASFLDKNHGTGIAYSSPAGSPHDFMGLVEAKKEGRILENLKVINTVNTFDKAGKQIVYAGSCPAEDKILKFNVKSSLDTQKLEDAKLELYKEEHYSGKLNELCAEFEGVYIKHAKDKVKEKLEKMGLGGTFLETSRRAVTRTNDNVIVANLEGQWFLNYKEDHIKEKAYNFLDNCKYLPEKLKDTQIGYIKWVEMRPCARKRGIGTNLPYDKSWIIEPLSDSTIYQMLYLIHHIIIREKINPEQLSFELLDYVMLGAGSIEIIIKQTKIKKEVILEMRREVEYWEGLDIRYTNHGHMSNHLSFLIYHYALIFPQKNWPKNITIGGYLIKDGAKISKSKGNGIPLMRMKDTYGVDMYRLYVAIAANYDVEMDFKDEDIFQLEKKFNKFKDLISKSLTRKVKNYDSFNITNKWLISKFYSYVENYFNMMNNMRLREAYVGIFYEFLNDMNYHERRTSFDETLDVIRFIAKDYIILMSSAVPHICEEFFESYRATELQSYRASEQKFVSLAKFETDYKKLIDKKVIDIENISRNLIENISRIKETKKLDKINKITLLQASDLRFELFDSISKLLEKTKDFKVIFSELSKNFPHDTKFIQKFVPKTLGSGLNAYLSKNDEHKLLTELKVFLEKEFNCEIELQSYRATELQSQKDKEINMSNVIPTEPLVLIE